MTPAGWLLQEARGLRLLAQRRRPAHADIAGAEDDRLLAAARDELVARARDLLEVEALSVKTSDSARGSPRRSESCRSP